MSDENKGEFEQMLNRLKVEIDPEEIESSIRDIGEKVRKMAIGSRYTKVRIKFRGKAVGPDIPLATFVAAEAVTFWYGGLIRALAVNLGVKTFIEIELIHMGDELVAEGQALFADGETEAAERKYREAIEIRPQDPSANYHLGVLLRVLRRHEEAILCLKISASTEDYIHSEKAQEILDKLERSSQL
jgi:tetratricopeptide (TPR) repeat protein